MWIFYIGKEVVYSIKKLLFSFFFLQYFRFKAGQYSKNIPILASFKSIKSIIYWKKIKMS